MIEPEDLARFRRHHETMLRMAGEDAAAFAQVVGLARELDDGLVDAASEARNEGFSYAELAAELGVGKAATFERFSPSPRPAMVDAAKRRLAAEGYDPEAETRLTIIAPPVGLAVVYGSQERTVWVHLRTCATEQEAAKLAAYLEGRVARWKLVRKPRDLPEWAGRLTEVRR